MSTIDTIKRNLPTSVPTPYLPAEEAFKLLVGAWKEYNITAAQEKTKRASINAQRDITIKTIEENSAILKLYLEKVFAERSHVIKGMFDCLDKGLISGNADMISLTIAAIVDVTKQSPLPAARELIANYHDPNVTEIEI